MGVFAVKAEIAVVAKLLQNGPGSFMAAFVDEKFVQMNETIQSDPVVDQVSSTLVTVSHNLLYFFQSLVV